MSLFTHPSGAIQTSTGVNDRVKVEFGEDPFTQEELAEERTYLPMHWKEALKVGRGPTRMVVERLRQLGLLERFEQHLALRNDQYVLKPGQGPGPLHFDPPIRHPFKLHSWAGVMVFGYETGETKVLKPFSSPLLPQHEYDLNTILTLMGSDIPYPGHDSYPTGTLLHSTVPFLHRRGLTFPGIRVAIDFGLMTDEQLKYE
jgi:hypothetical protein